MIDYLQLLPKRIKQVEIWEKNRKIMLMQMNQLSMIKDRTISYRFGDIKRAELNNRAFYDLDFCVTIRNAEDELRRFKDQDYTATFSLRSCMLPETLERFIRITGEKVIADIPHPQYNLLKTDKNDYIYSTYHDSSLMINIFKFH